MIGLLRDYAFVACGFVAGTTMWYGMDWREWVDWWRAWWEQLRAWGDLA